jgi:hypothetical protein
LVPWCLGVHSFKVWIVIGPKLAWQPAAQRALLGSACAVILYHSLLVGPTLFFGGAIPRPLAGEAAAALLPNYFRLLAGFFGAAMLLERINFRNPSRPLLLLGGLVTVLLQWKLMQYLHELRMRTGLLDEASKADFGKGHAASLGLNALLLLIAAVLWWKSPRSQAPA